MGEFEDNLKELILRCKKDPAFFIEKFCKVEHPKAGVLDFKLFEYQKRALKDYIDHKYNIYKKCRQCGISTLTGAYALWYAMFHEHSKVLIVSKRDDDAKEFLRKNVKLVYSYLPDWLKGIFRDADCKMNEHEIEFVNGSRIVSMTSSPETLRSASASLNIIDEAAFMPHMEKMWAGGQQCVSFGTMISTATGMVDIKNIVDVDNLKKFTNHNINVNTDIATENSDASWYNGFTDVISIRTKKGYEISATPNHRLRVLDDAGNYVWRYMSDINIGDDVCLKQNTSVDGNSNICIDLAEIIGYYIGDGSAYKSRPKRIILNTDPQDCDLRTKLIDNLAKIGIEAYEQKGHGTIDVRINNAKFVDSLNELGLLCKTNSKDACIPQKILESNSDVLSAFLRGLFEADGYCADSAYKKIGFSTSSKKLIDEVRVCLLALGILTKTFIRKSENRHSKDEYYELFIADSANMLKYKNKIGFISNRKNNLLNNISSSSSKPIKHNIVSEFSRKARKNYKTKTNEYDRLTYYIHSNSIPYERAVELCKKHDDLYNTKLGFLIKNDIYIDKIENIGEGKCHTGDISVPNNNTYIANGFVSHNTLVHGGEVIVISTCNGVGDWYWSTWMDAASKENDFNPIEINWWDMDWEIKFKSNGEDVTIQPAADIVENKSPEDIEKYGQYWSPWLEEQYRALTQRGESSKFRQEVLAEFIGSGDTILEGSILRWLGNEIEENKNENPYRIIREPQEYTDPAGDYFELNFENKLWIWKEPVPGHNYVMGFDISGGESRDFTGIQIFDMNTHEQVAELNLKILPKIAARMAAYLGEWYNFALMVVDSSGMGQQTAQDLEWSIGYPNLWRHKKKPQDRGKVGIKITQSNKQTLNKLLRDNIGLDGFTIHSQRLYRQLTIYINLGNGRSGNQPGIGNRDDLVIATGLAFLGALDNFKSEGGGLMPVRTGDLSQPTLEYDESMDSITDRRFIMPLSTSGFIEDEDDHEITARQDINRFATQITGIPRLKDESIEDYRARVKNILSKNLPAVKKKREFFKQDSRKINMKTRAAENEKSNPKRKSSGFKSAIVNKKKK